MVLCKRYSSNKETIASFQINEFPEHLSSSIATFLDFFSLEIDLFTLRDVQLNKITSVGIFMCKKKSLSSFTRKGLFLDNDFSLCN